MNPDLRSASRTWAFPEPEFVVIGTRPNHPRVAFRAALLLAGLSWYMLHAVLALRTEAEALRSQTQVYTVAFIAIHHPAFQ